MSTPALIEIEYLEDGTPYDPRTGEVYEPTQELKAKHEGFLAPITSDDEAEAILETRGQIEGEIDFLKRKKRAVIEQLDRFIRDRTRRLEWWDWRNRLRLVTYAREQLRYLKGKTVKFVHGSVAFRKSNGRREIISEDLAIAFIQRWKPELLRYKTPTLADIDMAIAEAVNATEDESFARPPFLLFEGDGESVNITTNINFGSPPPLEEQ